MCTSWWSGRGTGDKPSDVVLQHSRSGGGTSEIHSHHVSIRKHRAVNELSSEAVCIAAKPSAINFMPQTSSITVQRHYVRRLGWE